MNKTMKILSAVFLAVVALIATPIVSAAQIDINSVEACGIEYDTTVSTIYAERGETCDVIVKFTANADIDDLKLKAWIGGYEYDDIEDVTSMFDVESGVTYKKSLSLELPDDMDASEDYTINVEVYNKDTELVDKEYTLRVKEGRHNLQIQDVILRPDSTIEAGRSLFATIRVENMGDRKEEDIQVNIEIPDLGVSARDYIDELSADEDSDANEDNEDEEDSASSDEIYLKIPENAMTGAYDVIVKVVYSRGHEEVTKTETIYVVGNTPIVEEGKALVNVDAASKSADAGEEVSYKVMIANLNGAKHVYTVEATGADLFADVAVEPGFVTIEKGNVGESYVKLNVKEGASDGVHQFTIKVKADDVIVAEKTVTVDVNAASASNAKKTLAIAFGILVVLLIIIALILAFNKMRSSDSDNESYY
ncbi:MAG: hypothetical protein PHE43_01010 [Candidatus Nanoarchaeia archaeon]|nr:hypothetical protein [Candidatus Nanoarchaeia archaeon]